MFKISGDGTLYLDDVTCCISTEGPAKYFKDIRDGSKVETLSFALYLCDELGFEDFDIEKDKLIKVVFDSKSSRYTACNFNYGYQYLNSKGERKIGYFPEYLPAKLFKGLDKYKLLIWEMNIYQMYHDDTNDVIRSHDRVRMVIQPRQDLDIYAKEKESFKEVYNRIVNEQEDLLC